MAGSAPFGPGGSAWKYIIIFVVLIVVVVGAALGRLWWVRRRNRNIRKEERWAATRIDNLAGLKEATSSEGDLFGIRALEAGYTGGIAQPRPNSRGGLNISDQASPGHSQMSFIMDSPPRHPVHARTLSAGGRKSQAGIKLHPIPRTREISPQPSRPSTALSSRSGHSTMWFNSQQDATVPDSWYLPTSEQIFGNGPGIPSPRASPRASPRPSISLDRRSSVHTAGSIDSWDSATTKSRSKLQPSEAELTGRINHRSGLANVVSVSSDTDTTRHMSGDTTNPSIEDSRTSPSSMPRDSIPAFTHFPKTEDRSSESRGVQDFNFALDPPRDTRSHEEVNRQETISTSHLSASTNQQRPLSIQAERFSYTPPQFRPETANSQNVLSNTSNEGPAGSTSNSKRTSSSFAHNGATLEPTRPDSATSVYSELDNTYVPISSSAPMLHFESERSSVFAPFDLSYEEFQLSTTKSQAKPSPLKLETPVTRDLSSLHPGQYQSRNSTSSISSFESNGQDDTPKASFEEAEVVSAQEARSPREAPRLSFIRRSSTTPTLMSPVGSISRRASDMFMGSNGLSPMFENYEGASINDIEKSSPETRSVSALEPIRR